MLKLSDLRAARGAVIDEMTALTESRDFDPVKFKDLETKVAGFDEQIVAAERAQDLQRGLARPVAGQSAATDAEINPSQRTFGQVRAMDPREGLLGRSANDRFGEYVSLARRGYEFTPDRSRHFRSFGEQLQSVFTHYATKGSQTDSRLMRAPTGAGEVDPTGGGFLVQVDFAAAVFMLAHDMGEIVGRVNKIPISQNANGLKIPAVDESSRVTGSRWGGVVSNWVAEGVAGTESRPKFRHVEFDLKKLISKMTVTDELLQDSTALTSIAAKAFSEEIMWMTEDAIFEGSGAGQPLGIMNSPALVTVAKQTGQASGTLLKENIDNMWSRMWGRSRRNAIWTINQDVEPQLYSLNQVIGVGGVPVYLPPGGYSGAPFATLFGRPVVETEYNATLGTAGDIVLADFSQYTLVDKNGVQAATSMHVAFDTDEMRFRITYRLDGRPMWHTAIQPAKGTNTRSPFVALATR